MTGIFTLAASTGNLDAFRHGQYAEIGKPSVVTAGDASADKTSLDTVGLPMIFAWKALGRGRGRREPIFRPQELL